MIQNQWLLSRLKRGPLTPLDALREFGIYRLSARILELRQAGHTILTVPVRRGEKRFASYWLTGRRKK